MRSLASIFLAAGIILVMVKLANIYLPQWMGENFPMRFWEPDWTIAGAALGLGLVLWIVAAVIDRVREESTREDRK
jgi:hypothetical protein